MPSAFIVRSVCPGLVFFWAGIRVSTVFSRDVKVEYYIIYYGLGATESDYSNEKTAIEDTCSVKEDILNGEYDSDAEKSCEMGKDLVIGKISFVSCATGSEEPPKMPSEPYIETDDSPKQFGK